jgi:O-antigen/teichoic acid export membrane protein
MALASGVYGVRFSMATTAERLLPTRLALRARPLLGRIDAVLLSGDDRARAGRMSLVAFAIRVLSALIAFASQVLLARWMGSFEYGIFVLVWVTMVIVGNLSCLGFHTSVIRFIQECREQDRQDELRGIMLASRLLAIGAATAVALAGAAGIWLLRPAIADYHVVPFYLGLVCLPMIALSDVLQGIARAHSWAIAALAPIYITRPILILLFMALALAAGFPASAETAVISAIAATYVTTLIQLVDVTGRADRSLTTGARRFRPRTWFVISLPIFLVESFQFLLTNADVLMVGLLLQPQDVAVYFATVKTLALVHFVFFAVKAGVAQRYAQYAQDEDARRLGIFARETVIWTFWPSLLMGLLVIALGKPLLGLFGPGFDAGYPLLFLLVAGVLARASVGPAESLLTMSGHQNACAIVYGLTLLINVGLSLWLIPLHGLWGAAIATATAMGFEAAALAVTVYRRLGIAMSVVRIPVPAGGRH